MRNLLGIIGKPLGHSLSPILHTKAIEKLSADYTYEKWEIDENELEGFLKSVRDNDSAICGFNVTIPYKEKIIPFLDELDPIAAKLKAVNTVKYEKGRLIGYNTDGLGFLENLTRNKVEYENKKILILGSGGACKGIAMFLAGEKVAQIDIVARDMNKGEEIVSGLRGAGLKSKYISWTDLQSIKIEDYQIIVQTTPIGMKNQTGGIEFPYEKLSEDNMVIDIVYNPIETTFLRKCREKGAKGINGLEMLVYQGYHSFRIWTGLEEDTDLMLKTAEALLEVKSE